MLCYCNLHKYSDTYNILYTLHKLKGFFPPKIVYILCSVAVSESAKMALEIEVKKQDELPVVSLCSVKAKSDDVEEAEGKCSVEQCK